MSDKPGAGWSETVPPGKHFAADAKDLIRAVNRPMLLLATNRNDRRIAG